MMKKIISVNTEADIPQDLVDGDMVFIRNEIYIKNNNNLILMQPGDQLNLVSSYDEVKKLMKEILRNDDEILELKQLFINCFAQTLDYHTDHPETILEDLFIRSFGISLGALSGRLSNMENQVREQSRRVEYIICDLNNTTTKLNEEVVRLQSEMYRMREIIEELKHKI